MTNAHDLDPGLAGVYGDLMANPIPCIQTPECLVPAVVTNGCVKSLVRGSYVDIESGGRIGHIEDGESVAGSVGGLWAG